MSKLKQIVIVHKEEDCISYARQDIEEYEAMKGECALTHKFLMDSFRKLMGRTLTVIDACTGDKQQNKAMKDLIRQIYSDEMEFSGQFAYDQEVLQKLATASMAVADKLPEPITIEEALGVK